MALISNKSNPVQTVTMEELVKVGKGQLDRWPDGTPVSCVIRDVSSPPMKVVLEKVYQVSADAAEAAIRNANHGRKDHPAILIVDSDADVVSKVESTPGAIGMVDVYSITGGVTVLRVNGKLPLEPGYPLHGN